MKKIISLIITATFIMTLLVSCGETREAVIGSDTFFTSFVSFKNDVPTFSNGIELAMTEDEVIEKLDLENTSYIVEESWWTSESSMGSGFGFEVEIESLETVFQLSYYFNADGELYLFTGTSEYFPQKDENLAQFLENIEAEALEIMPEPKTYKEVSIPENWANENVEFAMSWYEDYEMYFSLYTRTSSSEVYLYFELTEETGFMSNMNQ